MTQNYDRCRSMYVFLGTFTFYEHGALTSGYWIAARRCCDNLSTNTLEVR